MRVVLTLIFVTISSVAIWGYAADTTESVFSNPLSAQNETQFMTKVNQLQLKKEQTRQFTQQKQIAALKRPLISKGTIVLNPKGICMATQSPFSSAVKITSDGIWQQTGNRKAIVKSADDHFEIRHTARILIALFTADKKVLQNRFSIFYWQNESQFQIGLRPKDRILAKIISNIVIEGSANIHRIAIREANGDTTNILISDETPTQHITLDTCIQ
ncbi:MAG: outer membrane lipoprotein carrier protein LolA [Deltaproteobacteria bacterium]|nr:outer membrane lipoprotein carrier protein LolA [Deltaproteobacteria bacterium]